MKLLMAGRTENFVIHDDMSTMLFVTKTFIEFNKRFCNKRHRTQPDGLG